MTGTASPAAGRGPPRRPRRPPSSRAGSEAVRATQLRLVAFATNAAEVRRPGRPRRGRATVQPCSLRTWSRQIEPDHVVLAGDAGEDGQRPDAAVRARGPARTRSSARRSVWLARCSSATVQWPVAQRSPTRRHRVGEQAVVDLGARRVRQRMAEGPGRELVVAVGEQAGEELRAQGGRRARRRPRPGSTGGSGGGVVGGHPADSTIATAVDHAYHARHVPRCARVPRRRTRRLGAVRGARRPDRRPARACRSRRPTAGPAAT